MPSNCSAKTYSITINILKTYFPLDRLRAESTPFYYYDMQLLDETINCIKKSAAYPGFYVHYAVKANANPEILKRIAAAGMGADTVSIGEIKAAIDAGFPAPKIEIGRAHV